MNGCFFVFTYKILSDQCMHLLPKYCNQGVTKRCRLSFLTNSALVYEPKCRGRREGCGVSANEHSCVHGAQKNFGDRTPYLTYDCSVSCLCYLASSKILVKCNLPFKSQKDMRDFYLKFYFCYQCRIFARLILYILRTYNYFFFIKATELQNCLKYCIRQ